MTYWKRARRLQKLCKEKRREAAEQLLPAIRAICETAEIEMRTTEHGYQFIKKEYIVNWYPSSNKVRIQYRLSGHGHTSSFDRSGKLNKPRIIVALEDLIDVARTE